MKGKIFNAQEVQAIIAGNKTQFREVIKGAELEISHPAIDSWAQSPNDQKFYAKAKNDEVKQQFVTTFPFHGIKCPYQVGQKIFCKESFWEAGGNIIYRADYESYKPISPWRRAMKQEQSRLTLQIKEIKVERLADISEEDAIAEGMEKTGCLYLQGKTPDENKWVKTEISDFAKNWNATHKKPEEKFEANFWVWCVNFEVVK